MLRCLTATIAAALLVPTCAAAPASATQRIEAERLHGAGHVFRDARASRGRGLRLAGRGRARARVRVRARSRLRVVARGDRCRGAPRLVVAVDGRRALSFRPRRSRWRSASGRRVVSAGRHTISLRLANPRRARGCRRAARVDALLLDAIPPSATPPAGAPGIWRPAPRTTWQWQLSGSIDASVDAEMFDVDLFDTPASLVADLHARGRRAVCYMSAGTLETAGQRPDAARFAAPVVGKALDDWPGERWVDVRRLDVLGPIMERRLDLCREKGFDGVEADNVDAYANDSGFPLTAADQLAYNRFLARAAHARGLSIGLKNDLEQAAELEPDFDWAINEQCFQYDECERLEPFVNAGKAVFTVEYELDADRFCERSRELGFMSMRKRLDLDAWREPCW